MTDCIFCKIIAGEIPCYKIYEDNKWLAFLDIKPINLGHTLLLPKKHCCNLLDFPQDLLPEIGPLLQKLGRAIKDGTGADGLNISWNNEPAAGQIIFHAHLHLIPRFKDDNLKPWPNKEVSSQDSLPQWQEKICAKLKILS